MYQTIPFQQPKNVTRSYNETEQRFEQNLIKSKSKKQQSPVANATELLSGLI